jgi:hypothetical protein
MPEQAEIKPCTVEFLRSIGVQSRWGTLAMACAWAADEIERLRTERRETYEHMAEWHEEWARQFRSLAAIERGQVISLDEAIEKLSKTVGEAAEEESHAQAR